VTYEVFVTDKASGQRESTDEYLEFLDGLIRRERLEQAGGTQVDYPPVLERLGVDATDWEKSVLLTSRRFSRELAISAMMFAEARQRG